MSISLEVAERMYDRLYSDEEEYEEPDINPLRELGTGGLKMREILFRGKRKDNGEWIYGDLRHISDWLGGYNPHIVDNRNGRNNSVTGVEVDPETVGQYTGLTDKNGEKNF